LFHEFGQLPGGVLEDQVIMVIHDAIGEDPYLLSSGLCLKDVKKSGFGFVVVEYLLTAMPPVHHVMVGALIG